MRSPALKKRMENPEQKPTHVYVARKPCGCVVGLVSDYADKDTGRAVGEFIGWGLTVDRVDWEKYVNEVSNEAGFMACIHIEPQPEQIAMF